MILFVHANQVSQGHSTPAVTPAQIRPYLYKYIKACTPHWVTAVHQDLQPSRMGSLGKREPMMLGRTMKNASTEFATKSLHEDQVMTWECASWHACTCSQLATLLSMSSISKFAGH